MRRADHYYVATDRSALLRIVFIPWLAFSGSHWLCWAVKNERWDISAPELAFGWIPTLGHALADISSVF